MQQKMQTYEFRVLCKDDEACKRVRFYMETGIVVKPLKENRTNILGTPFYEEARKTGAFDKNCKHEIQMHYHYELAFDPEHSIEMNCKKCDSLLTLIPTDYECKEGEYKGRKLFAVVDFENYDRKSNLEKITKPLAKILGKK